MSQDKTRSNDTADHKREITVYKYLLSFTDLGLEDNDTISALLADGPSALNTQKNRLPNESLIASQWSCLDKKNTVGVNRVYVRRVLRCVYGESLYLKKSDENWSWPGLSMAKLVFILSSLEKYWDSKADSIHRSHLSKVTHSVKVKAIQMFSELSFEERNLLNMPVRDGEGLIQKIHEDILNPSYKFRYEEFVRIYEQFLASKTMHHLGVFYRDTKEEAKETTISSVIDDHISELTNGGLSTEQSNTLRERILGEIYRIEFQSGAEQLNSISNRFDYRRQIISMSRKMFVRNLTKCIIENEGMTNELPVSIKFFEIEKVRPLPLSIYDKARNKIGLINPNLLNSSGNEIAGLQRQYTYKIALHFCIRDKDNPAERKIDFFEEITGIGSPISHAMIAMDRVLMWDIPCIQEYFPVTRQQFSNDTIIGGNKNSAVWSHCVVQLYRKSEIKIALDNGKTLEEIGQAPVSHHGEYCGFDVFEVSIKAAFIARLRAIKHLLKEKNITSDEYLEQLRTRVKEYSNLCKAKSLLQYYPFSLGAMKAKINSDIFMTTVNGNAEYKYRNSEGLLFTNVRNGERWSSVAYDAQLKIAEALLKEGRTVNVKKYLSILDDHVQYLSALMLARYYVCYAQYHFLSDLASESNDNPNRQKAISESERCLKLAEDSLKRRLRECELLGELSHSNTHPFFEIYSKISLVKARIFLYFPSYANIKDNGIWYKTKAPLIEAEKARIYSARDGNSSLYFSQSCFEAWAYLIIGFTWDFEREPKENEGFSKEDCIRWAERLWKHAIICYEKTGIKCYSEIKRNAGFLIDIKDRFGENIKVDGIPFIMEIDPNKPRENDKAGNILDLNLDFFKTIEANLEGEVIKRPIFFGTDSSNIMFTDGMIELCRSKNNTSTSFENSEIFRNILSAMRKFVIAWSTSRDGALCTQEKGVYFIEEIFDKSAIDKETGRSLEKESDAELLRKIDKNNDRYIRGFYPHRISKTSIFSKLFIGVCLLVVKCKSQDVKQFKDDNNIQYEISWDEISWDEIREFARGLHEEDIPERPNKQIRFNGHLADHITQIVKYFDSFENWANSSQCKSWNLVQVRDKVVKDMFLLVRGHVIKP
jgi:hypothetical protein